MPALVIDRKTLPETLFPPIDANRVRVESETDRVVLTPAAEADDADGDYIDPDDYPDTTAYLNALPGVAERIIKSVNAPLSEFEDWDWRKELGLDNEKQGFAG